MKKLTERNYHLLTAYMNSTEFKFYLQSVCVQQFFNMCNVSLLELITV
jgi:hypothetical protein